MIVTDVLQYIPFSHMDRSQVAQLLGRSTGAVDYYVKRGVKVCEGHIIYLKKERSGKFLTSDVLDFIEAIKNYRR